MIKDFNANNLEDGDVIQVYKVKEDYGQEKDKTKTH